GVQLARRTTQQWLNVLDDADVWCADVFEYAKLVQHEAYKALRMEQTVRREGVEIRTTRCPLRIDGEILTSDRAAPRVGQDQVVTRDFQPGTDALRVESHQHGSKARVTMAPLDGVLVLDLSQFLSGPCASL